MNVCFSIKPIVFFEKSDWTIQKKQLNEIFI